MKYEVICKKCGKHYTVECSKNNFEKGKYSHYCSISCRNSHIVSDEIKMKISNAVKQKTQRKIKKCVFCGKEFYPNGKEKFCCEDCKSLYKQCQTFSKYFGFNLETLGTQYAIHEVEKVKKLLVSDYWENELTSTQIANKYGYPSPCNLTGKIFKYLGIPSRTLSQQNILSYLNGSRSTKQFCCKWPYKQEWHTTWDGNEVFLRSSYEIDYAMYLDEQKIDYSVESLKIKYFDTSKNIYRCAIPDFYIKDTNTIVEVKSLYTLDIQEMKDKVKAYKLLGYNFKLILEHKEIDINSL